MKKTIPLSIIIILTFFISTGYTTADEIPTPPHRFKGYVFDNTSEPAVNGTIVSAKVHNIFYNTTVKNGTYGFPLETEAFYVNGSDGDVISFYIHGVLTTQTTLFVSGGLNINFAQYLNLSLDESPLLISSVATSSVSTTQETISWATNKKANATVNYGITKHLGLSSHNNQFSKTHTITLTNLQSDTTYYYEVVSYDYSSHLAVDNNSGQYYQFTTEQETNGGDGGNGGNGGNGGGIPGQPNKSPHANANGPYYGRKNQPMLFDASKSNDSDGYIVNYTWSFGDGTTISTTQLRIAYSFVEIGNYTVSLTVVDNEAATNATTTKAYISTNDSDNDGWTDDAERYYGTDPNNASDFPLDSDHDGIPDSVDPDNDNDGLTDEIEIRIGTNPTNSSDVLRLLTSYGVFYFVDTNVDGIIDKYYNQTTVVLTGLFDAGNGTFLVDTNNDSTYEFEYNSVQKSITPYQTPHTLDRPSTMLLILLGIVIVILIIVLVVMLRMKGKKE